MDAATMMGNDRKDDLAGFKSPRRILAGFFKRSRDQWKAKYQRLQKENKRFCNRAADAVRARERWRQRAESSEAQTKRLRTQLRAAQAESVSSKEAQKKG